MTLPEPGPEVQAAHHRTVVSGHVRTISADLLTLAVSLSTVMDRFEAIHDTMLLLIAELRTEAERAAARMDSEDEDRT